MGRDIAPRTSSSQHQPQLGHYLQSREVVRGAGGDGGLHIEHVVVPEEVPQLLLVLVYHLNHPGKRKVAWAS